MEAAASIGFTPKNCAILTYFAADIRSLRVLHCDLRNEYLVRQERRMQQLPTETLYPYNSRLPSKTALVIGMPIFLAFAEAQS